MTEQHPITPPPELVQQWSHDCPLTDPFNRELYVATLAARWGADQELEACRLWVSEESIYAARELVEARRPKQPSLSDKALAELEEMASILMKNNLPCNTGFIRRALEALPDD